MIRLLCWAIFLTFLAAITPAMAAREVPDQKLIDHVGAFPLVHHGKCKVDSMNIVLVDCKIFFDEVNSVVWLCLYDAKGRLTHIVASKDGKEQIVWVRPSLTS